VTDAPIERERDGPWGRLRSRKVVQWGLLYVAGAWGFLQGLEYLSGTYDWPRQIQQLTTLALLVGLPIVLVLAWYHGDRGEQRVSRSELAIITVLFLLGGGIFWWYQRSSQVPSVASATPEVNKAIDALADDRPSIAVLPFENRSKLADDAYFVDGIHDDILTQLSKISALKVISRTSVEQFRDTKLSMKVIAEQLGVAKILEGGVQRAGDRVRINVQLIDASSDAHLWAETYDRELTAANIFAIQSELAASIAGAMRTALSPEEKDRVAEIPTQSLEAWDAYQRGRQEMAARTSAGLVKSERFFREAIRFDPAFALAHVGLADALQLQTEYGGADPAVGLAMADGAVSEALRLNPNLAEAWASSAGIADDRRDFKRAEQRYLRAIELNPNYAQARQWYALMLTYDLGRPDAALPQIQRAAELDPLSATVRGSQGHVLKALGRFTEAQRTYLEAIELDPSAAISYSSLAYLYVYALNRVADGAQLWQRARTLDPDSPILAWSVAQSYIELSDDGRASELAAEAVRRWPNWDYTQVNAAFAQLLVGNTRAATEHAHLAVRLHPRDWAAISILRNNDIAAGHMESALARYQTGYPELFVAGTPVVNRENLNAAIDGAATYRHMGVNDRARVLLDCAATTIAKMPRLGDFGYGISDVQVHALRGDKVKALAALREAQSAGWRGPLWRYYRDFDPALDSIRNEPQFKAVFTDIERDMAKQRAALAARPKDAPLDVAAAGT
jgi:TolB-like protein/Flp pilus assembly protein TadD